MTGSNWRVGIIGVTHKRCSHGQLPSISPNCANQLTRSYGQWALKRQTHTMRQLTMQWSFQLVYCNRHCTIPSIPQVEQVINICKNFVLGFNYGAIGMIIGHEITHGFDDQGRHMGANGNMENWWGEETERNFATRSQCMEEQYGNLEFAGMKLNGKLTLGENIADNGGIKIAYNAWVSDTTIK